MRRDLGFSLRTWLPAAAAAAATAAAAVCSSLAWQRHHHMKAAQALHAVIRHAGDKRTVTAPCNIYIYQYL